MRERGTSRWDGVNVHVSTQVRCGFESRLRQLIFSIEKKSGIVALLGLS